MPKKPKPEARFSVFVVAANELSTARCSGFNLLGFGQADPTPSVRYWRWYQEYKRGGFDRWFIVIRLLADEFCRNSPLSSADDCFAMVVTGSILVAAPQRREGRDLLAWFFATWQFTSDGHPLIADYSRSFIIFGSLDPQVSCLLT